MFYCLLFGVHLAFTVWPILLSKHLCINIPLFVVPHCIACSSRKQHDSLIWPLCLPFSIIISRNARSG